MYSLIRKLKITKKLTTSIKRKFDLFENYENIKLPEKFNFTENKNLIKSNISKKNLNH